MREDGEFLAARTCVACGDILTPPAIPAGWWERRCFGCVGLATARCRYRELPPTDGRKRCAEFMILALLDMLRGGDEVPWATQTARPQPTLAPRAWQPVADSVQSGQSPTTKAVAPPPGLGPVNKAAQPKPPAPIPPMNSLYPSLQGNMGIGETNNDTTMGTVSQAAGRENDRAGHRNVTSDAQPASTNMLEFTQQIDLKRLIVAVNIGRWPPTNRFQTVPEMLEYFSIDVNNTRTGA